MTSVRPKHKEFSFQHLPSTRMIHTKLASALTPVPPRPMALVLLLMIKLSSIFRLSVLDSPTLFKTMCLPVAFLHRLVSRIGTRAPFDQKLAQFPPFSSFRVSSLN